MYELMSPYLTRKGVELSHAVIGVMADTTKASDEDKMRARVLAFIEAMDLEWSDLPAQVSDILAPFAVGAAADGLHQIEVTLQVATDLANERAVEWARNRSAEMVGMKWVDGALVTNPKAEWAINESTRDMLGNLVTQAIDEGWSNDRLAKEIGSDGAFSDERAMTIARTETAMADVQGNVAAYTAANDSGIELLKEWLTVGDDAVSEDCQANEDAGPIPLDAIFPSGASAPPDHPNCRCDVLPVRLATLETDTTDTED